MNTSSHCKIAQTRQSLEVDHQNLFVFAFDMDLCNYEEKVVYSSVVLFQRKVLCKQIHIVRNKLKKRNATQWTYDVDTSTASLKEMQSGRCSAK